MRWLVPGGLKFVLARKVGKEDVDEGVYSCRDEEVDNLRKDDSWYLNPTYSVVGAYRGPGVLDFLDTGHFLRSLFGRFSKSVLCQY